jgi:hypothetical protein
LWKEICVITRYRCTYANDIGDEYDAFSQESADGEYVLFTDAESALAAKDAEIADLNQKLDFARGHADRIHSAAQEEINSYRTERQSLAALPVQISDEQILAEIDNHWVTGDWGRVSLDYIAFSRALLAIQAQPQQQNVHLAEPAETQTDTRTKAEL